MKNKNPEEVLNGDNVIKKIIARSWEDPIFKQELIDKPIETIEKVIGKKIGISPDIKLKVIDQSNPSVIYLNIPHEDVSRELSDAQLESIVGGKSIVSGPVKTIKWLVDKISDLF